MTPPLKPRGPESRGESPTPKNTSEISEQVGAVNQRVGDILILNTLEYQIIDIMDLGNERFAKVKDESGEETYLIYKDDEYRDFTNGSSEVAVYELSSDGKRARISRKGESFHLHNNGDITLNSKYPK